MLEKILISLATSLFEKLGKYLFNWYEEHKTNEREHERIGKTVERLVDAESIDDLRGSFNDLM